ncbi:hypothetical protein A2U01_0024671, partial [Trifolium medium]|nr:hypothetical protein [Trifolium medium]
YSLEYLDKDETIVAHLVKGIDAYIKLSHGWPIFGSPLKLISIKGLDILKKKSASFHCEVEMCKSILYVVPKFSPQTVLLKLLAESTGIVE